MAVHYILWEDDFVATMTRKDKDNYYLSIAETVLERGTCLRRNYGAIIVKFDQIVSTGYTGAPRGRKTASIWVSVSEKA